MKKRILLLFLSFFLLFTASGCSFRDSDEQAKFEGLIEEYFYLYVSDPMTVNFTLDKPEKYGLEDLQVTAYAFSEENYQAFGEQLVKFRERLKAVRYNSLTAAQQMTYDVVLADLDNLIAFIEYPYHLSNLGATLGYQVMLPIALSEYRFKNANDIADYFAYLSATRGIFEGMVEFEKTRVEKGFGFPLGMYSLMAEQCGEIAATEEIFLIPIFNDKIAAAGFLTDAERNDLKTEHLSRVGEFIDAYAYLREELEKIEAPSFPDGGLCAYADGADLYELIVRADAGCDMDIDEIYDYLYDKMEDDMRFVANYLMVYPEMAAAIDNPNFLSSRDKTEIFELLREAAEDDFPFPADEFDVRFEDIHPLLRDYVSPAFYLLSPIDAEVTEVIYINEEILTDATQAYFTIAHESIPGHMLQHNVLKKSDWPDARKVMDFIGYSEGWAVYVEEYIGKYLDVDETLLRAYMAARRINYTILCLAEIEVHYYGLNLNELRSWFRDFGGISADDLYEIYYLILEEPGYFLKYYLSYYLLSDLKEDFIFRLKREKIDTDNYDYEFHKFYLDFGPAPFYVMEKWIKNYIDNNY